MALRPTPFRQEELQFWLGAGADALGDVILDRGRVEEAASLLRVAVEKAKATLPPTDLTLPNLLTKWGRCLVVMHLHPLGGEPDIWGVRSGLSCRNIAVAHARDEDHPRPREMLARGLRARTWDRPNPLVRTVGNTDNGS